MTSAWKQVWDARRLDESIPSTLGRLMAADGLDTAFGRIDESAWSAFIVRTAATMRLEEGSSVFEVGCGAGAFLYGLRERGCRVAGLDQSAALIDYARRAMPDAELSVGDADALLPAPRVDAVAACGVFLYFPSLEYAGSVLARMAAKATTTLAVLDVPDKSREVEAMRLRREALGGTAEYEARYRGLDHLYFERAWFRHRLQAAGFADIRIEDQQVEGSANASSRFNVFAFRS